MQHKRLAKRLEDYWDRLRRDAPLPKIERFDGSAISDVITRCCLWRIEPSKHKKVPIYVAEYVGEEMKKVIGADIAGEIFSPPFRYFPAARIFDKIDEAVTASMIISDEGRFINTHDKIVKFQSSLLPFGTKDGKVTYVLIGVSWRIY